MTIATLPPTSTEPLVLEGISWALYEQLLKETEGQHLYITYFQGSMELMPPSNFHERYKTILGRLIEMMTVELDIEIASCGSTTWKKPELLAGLEPDECYYVQNEPKVRHNYHIDLAVDPPPDLALEMDYTHHGIDREQVYAALGVPEIWRFDGARLEVLLLGASGQFEPAQGSLAFPFLPMREFEQFVLAAPGKPETSMVREFRGGVRTAIKRP
jgi:Uma2 family endonuclease